MGNQSSLLVAIAGLTAEVLANGTIHRTRHIPDSVNSLIITVTALIISESQEFNRAQARPQHVNLLHYLVPSLFNRTPGKVPAGDVIFKLSILGRIKMLHVTITRR